MNESKKKTQSLYHFTNQSLDHLNNISHQSLHHFTNQALDNLNNTPPPQTSHLCNQYITSISTSLQHNSSSESLHHHITPLRHLIHCITSIMTAPHSLHDCITSMVSLWGRVAEQLLELVRRSGCDAKHMVRLAPRLGQLLLTVSRFETWGGCRRAIVFGEVRLQFSGRVSMPLWATDVRNNELGETVVPSNQTQQV